MIDTSILRIAPDDRVGLSVRNLTVGVGPAAKMAPKDPQSESQKESQDTASSHNILDDVSFDLPSGHILAIMGGSGSGKTTLLNMLSQRVNVTNKKLNFQGLVEYLRDGGSATIKSAYLLQTDVFLPGLTVHETLQTQADLRLPASTTSHEKSTLIESLLEVLELTAIRNERICSFSTHSTTLSGGEQRRVSMAIQLLSKPSILFLDEPTTGLDTSSSLKLVRVLKKLASPEYGITVVLSIHQPRPEISALFDKFCLLTRGGRLVYYGNLADTNAYFKELKFLASSNSKQSPASFIEYIIELSIKDTSSKLHEQMTLDRINRLVQHWKSHTNYQPLHLSHKEQQQKFRDNLRLFDRDKKERISFFRELTVLTKRTFVLSYRDTASLVALNLGSVLLALATGWMFYQPRPDLAGIRTLTSTLYVMLEVVGFCPMFFELERLWSTDGVFFYREYGEKYVSIPGFIISRRLGKLLLEDLPVALFFSCITYFMWGLRLENGSGERDLSFFGTYVAITILVNFVGMASSLFVFAVSSDFSMSALVFNAFYQLQNSACGYFVNASSMPVYVRWTKYLCYFWYGFGALSANQFAGWMGDCPYDRDDPRCTEYSGDYNLHVLGFPGDWTPQAIGILVAWYFGFNILTALAFKFMRFEISMGKIKENKFGGEEEAEESSEDEANESLDKKPKQKDINVETNNFIELDAENVSQTNSYDSNSSNVDSSLEAYHPATDDISLNIESLNLAVAMKSFFGQTVDEKVLLDNISASFIANRVNVIMGPSGSGKTTLLNYLSHRLSKSSSYKSMGRIYINKVQLITREELSKISAYVTQHDNSLIPNLTVRETLYFQAKLRLPHDEHSRIPQLVSQLIRQMGLVDCADTLVGSEFVKGISGGEKRRVSIAVQLLGKPKILFLDEPTSGLDSTNALKILNLLSDIALSKKTTIVLTVHQPQQEMFYQFGSVLLLARGGRVVFNGPTKNVSTYLETIGYLVPQGINIADFMLDLISNKVDEDQEVSQERIHHMIECWKHKNLEGEKLGHSTPETEALVSKETGSGPISLQQYVFKKSPLAVTFPVVARRQLLNAVRSKDVLISRAGQTVFLTVIHALFFAPLRNHKDGIDNRLGLVQEALNLYYVGLLNNIALYPVERDIFYQEHKDGIYGVLEFSGSYLLNELPTEIVPCLFFSSLIVFAVGLPRTPGMFFGMFSTCLVSISCGESLGILVNSCFNHMGVATNILTNTVILAIFMAGTMSLDMPLFFDAINYISPMKYGVGICAKLGFAKQKFQCDVQDCALSTGQAVLENYGLDVNLGAYFGGLFACFVAYRAIAVASVWAHSVQITGNFDNWSKSLHAHKLGSVFEQTVTLDHRQRLVFKFVVDGDWVLNRDYATEWHDGVENNVVEAVQLEEVPEHHPVPEPVVAAAPNATLTPKHDSPVAPDAPVAPVTPAPKQSSSNLPLNSVPAPSPPADPEGAPLESFPTDEDLLSDFDESVDVSGTKRTPVNTDASSKSDRLTQVLTSSSSFAAVSLLSSENDFHDIGDQPASVVEEDQFNTPTNSLFNSVVLPSSTVEDRDASAPEQPDGSNTANTSIANFNINSRNNSFTKPKLATNASDSTIPRTSHEVVAILKAPGGYPVSPKDKNEDLQSPRNPSGIGKRENLISRFKGLFKY
ncbi:uncharacterized protein CANTADRAFT_6284 [Suhomyces tanzawaensis NRRL Y-17324]|uniref:ABC transporter domain-containing protein n=1 Tax=Suhomyces tanzawaensis NRRL Y-17324 TaxID=984487 RepID=A0A1E4SHW6_9ASCO|nr:uncharacterized protein CANTADRAFT_6284 [Suhomyces tanzawaensis NRRL Y-17324]ODV79109.1 hypothetical protein CANTADRAFT_6284 [Suhomyces tanzawaensis NRRL Y-17324]